MFEHEALRQLSSESTTSEAKDDHSFKEDCLCVSEFNCLLCLCQRRKGHVSFLHRLIVIYRVLMSILFRDEDMQSLASLMSVNTIGDIAPLEDFEEEDCKYLSEMISKQTNK